MAKHVYNVKYESWEEYYKQKREEPGNYFHHFAKKRILAFDSLPSGFINRPESSKSTVAAYPKENSLLIPAGGNLIRCIHHCFLSEEFGKQDSVIGISGSCRSSDFKRLNVDGIVKKLSKPRTSRNSKSPGDGLWVPNIEDFLGCDNAEEFKNAVAFEKENPPSDLWNQAQSTWIHPDIFEVMDTNKPQRAGDLAAKILLNIPGEIPDHSGDERDEDDQTTPDKEVYQLILLLWAIKNLRASKVPLIDAPTSKAFDDAAEILSNELNPRIPRIMQTTETRGIWTSAANEGTELHLGEHLDIFEVMDTNKPQRAGDLAAKILLNIPGEIPNHSGDERDEDDQTTPDKEVYQLILLLWAIKNLRASKVPLIDAPTSRAFDDAAEIRSDELNPRIPRLWKQPRPRGIWTSAANEGTELHLREHLGEDPLHQRTPRARQNIPVGIQGAGHRGDLNESQTTTPEIAKKEKGRKGKKGEDAEQETIRAQARVYPDLGPNPDWTTSTDAGPGPLATELAPGQEVTHLTRS